MTDLSASSALPSSHLGAVRCWLISVAVLIAAMVLVGGVTRLTESGLSIVEWKPVSGVLPPLSDQAWTDAFEAYKQIPQYQEINADMTLSEFKTIFWWEFSHRLLGRVIGAAYLLPFLFFLWRGALTGELRKRLWSIFALGALQGVIGWWMVASGLTERVEVSQYRLATHLVLALVIFAAIVWTFREIKGEVPPDAPPRVKFVGRAILVVTFVQIYLGALVAGLRAGLVYNTWPAIDGGFVPTAARLWYEDPWWRNLFENALTVQFDHRMMAYALFLLALWHAVDATRSRAPSAISNGAWLLFAAIMVQAVLGILTLLGQVPLPLALTHQAVAIVVLTLAVLQAELLSRQPATTVDSGVARPAGASATPWREVSPGA
ncbi:COX15/CtaA family protein [Bradyrhizobium sp.]|uniref:COX15/CtaA family protein n=1 Tax=Bradyrhizobium sp. TaxID=376 RepID=UPI0025C45FC3|nr:COX15/CtaA family protein [Bradyrhizobium sp.]MBV8917126.1 COX15/CtaA family protein [Bradyrhizobium sp.]